MKYIFNLYVYMQYSVIKTMCPPGYNNGFVATHALEHMMYGCNIFYHVPKYMSCDKAIVVITGKAHCFHDCIYITPVLLLLDLSALCVGDQLLPPI